MLLIIKCHESQIMFKLLNWIYVLILIAYKNVQRRRIEAVEMKLLRPLAGHTLYDHKTNDSISHELQTECILDKIDEYRRNWLLHLQRMPHNRNPFKIIPLQSTRKENNRETKETLARAAVTLEKEWAKWPNPWCLWWWWWWWYKNVIFFALALMLLIIKCHEAKLLVLQESNWCHQ